MLLAKELMFYLAAEPSPCKPHQFETAKEGCESLSSITGWPTFQSVLDSRFGEADNYEPGQRGQTINGCQAMSFFFQLSWTASASFYFMITVDMMLDLFTSP
eukprot:SAG25_NODE_1354_length_3222_cov_16.742235_1_plen_101_part_10